MFDEMGLQVHPEKSRRGTAQVDRTPTMELKDADEGLFEHVRNFLDCVKSRQRPVCDIEVGQKATNACHLANIAYRTQSRLTWDAAKQELTQGGPDARQLLGVEYRAPWKLAM
jgi:hypothetical protein